MKRWVGFGVIADSLINLGGMLAKQTAADSTEQTLRKLKRRHFIID
jgi:hypothetical protein